MKQACLFLCIAFVAVGCGGTESDIGRNDGFVCGADGQSYTIEDADGKDVRHRGKCGEPMQCNGPSDCFINDACIVLDGVGDGVHSVCVPGPITCACPAVYDPVCGADGRTYGNECEAHCAGVMVAHAGPCDDPPGNACVRSGCSGQLCVEEGMDIATTCEWRPVYECYQQATCERQQNGQCGFTPTHELVECLESHGMGMCEVDPAWQMGFEADCFAPDFMIEATVQAYPLAPIGLGITFPAEVDINEPINLGRLVAEVTLSCDGNEVIATGEAAGITAECRNLRPIGNTGECFSDDDCRPDERCAIFPPIFATDGPDATSPPFQGFPGVCVPRDGTCNSDRDCREGEFCQLGHPGPWPAGDEHELTIAPIPPPVGVCIDKCAVILCAPGYFCDQGECIPGGCPEIYAPVCGTDGKTYSNECEAHMAGVMVAHQGECELGECDNNRDCRGDLICYPPTKTCQPQCFIDCFRYDPVCGVDGVTYGCGPESAWCAGVEVAYPGECEPDPCALIDCAPGYICQQGQCIPLACPDIYDPVCGIDGVTYGNGCEANLAGVEIAYEGVCNPCGPGRILTPDGQCEIKCYSQFDCGDEEACNVNEVCLQDPECPACDVCVGWCDDGCPDGFTNPGDGSCVPTDCRNAGCDEPGATCVECATPDGGGEWTCLGPNQGICLPPPGDCRTEGCDEGSYCGFCWTDWACIPEGAVC